MNRVNLIPKREYTRIAGSWRDTGMRQWDFHIFNGKDRWTIDADSVTMECSNGAVIPCTVQNNTVTVQCTEELAAAPGRHRCKFIFIKDGMRLSSQAFDLWVEGF